MRMIGRVCLVVMVAISLVAAGMPFAHAMRAAAPAPMHEMHHHAVADHVSGHAMHDAQHVAHAGVQHHDDSAAVIDLLNGKICCSMCAIAYVAPSLGQTDVIRVSFPIRYWVRTAFQPDTPAAIDPGIPIV
jgi:hypothetical protein